MGLIDVVMNIQEFMTYTAVVTNCAILFFTFPNFAEAAFNIAKDDTTTKLWVIIILEHVVIIIKAFLANCIPDAPTWVLAERDSRASKVLRDSNYELQRERNKNDKLKKIIQDYQKQQLLNATIKAHQDGGSGGGGRSRDRDNMENDRMLRADVPSTGDEAMAPTEPGPEDNSPPTPPEEVEPEPEPDRTNERQLGGGKAFTCDDDDGEYDEFADYYGMGIEEEEEEEEEETEEEHDDEEEKEEEHDYDALFAEFASSEEDEEQEKEKTGTQEKETQAKRRQEKQTFSVATNSRKISQEETKKERRERATANMNKHVEAARARRKEILPSPLGDINPTKPSVAFARLRLAHLLQKSDRSRSTSDTLSSSKESTRPMIPPPKVLSTTAGREAIAKYVKIKKPSLSTISTKTETQQKNRKKSRAGRVASASAL